MLREQQWICMAHTIRKTHSKWNKRNKVLKIQQTGMLNARTEVTALFAIVTLVITTSFYLLSKNEQEKGNSRKHWAWQGEAIKHFERK